MGGGSYHHLLEMQHSCRCRSHFNLIWNGRLKLNLQMQGAVPGTLSVRLYLLRLIQMRAFGFFHLKFPNIVNSGLDLGGARSDNPSCALFLRIKPCAAAGALRLPVKQVCLYVLHLKRRLSLSLSVWLVWEHKFVMQMLFVPFSSNGLPRREWIISLRRNLDFILHYQP